VLTEKNFNKTCFAEGAKSVVFFNDVEEDGENGEWRRMEEWEEKFEK
jgi:hypothetical protein